MSTTTPEKSALFQAKTAFLADAGEQTFSDFLDALEHASVWVPVRVMQEDGEEMNFKPLLVGDGVLACFSMMEESEGTPLPEGAVMVEVDFQAILDVAVDNENGLYIDPFTDVIPIFKTAEGCRDLKNLLYPVPEIRGLGELIELKQKACSAGDAEVDFLKALSVAQVYVHGVAIYSDEDEKRFRGLKTGDTFTNQDPVRFRLDTVTTENGEYVAVYLSKAYIPSGTGEIPLDSLPDDAPADRLTHYQTRKISMLEIIEKYSRAEQLSGVIVDPDSPTGAVTLEVCVLQAMQEHPVKRPRVLYDDVTKE